MIYAIVAFFLFASVLLLVGLCRTAKIFSEHDLEVVTSDAKHVHSSGETAVVKRDEAA